MNFAFYFVKGSYQNYQVSEKIFFIISVGRNLIEILYCLFCFSVTLGGFGVDRFYIGLWRSGIGKLFSFGGLGVWTIVDVVLIAVGYVGPHDGSLYIYPWN